MALDCFCMAATAVIRRTASSQPDPANDQQHQNSQQQFPATVQAGLWGSANESGLAFGATKIDALTLVFAEMERLVSHCHAAHRIL